MPPSIVVVQEIVSEDDVYKSIPSFEPPPSKADKVFAEFATSTEPFAAAESPVLQQAPKLPVTVWVGAEERPVFLDQARWLVEAWQADPERPDLEQTDVGHVVSPGQHHFNVIEDMAHAQSTLTTALFA